MTRLGRFQQWGTEQLRFLEFFSQISGGALSGWAQSIVV